MEHILLGKEEGFDKTSYIRTIIEPLMEDENEEAELVMIDTDNKLSQFKEYPYVVNDIALTPEKAVESLQWVLDEMNDRYAKFKLTKIYSFERYNILQSQEALKKEDNPRLMSRMIVLISDLADLMEYSSEEVETLIIKIMQLGANAGIHLIIETDSCSEEVITHLINACVPTIVGYTPFLGYEGRLNLDSPHPGQIPTTRKAIEHTVMEYDFKTIKALVRCMVNEENENLYKNYLMIAASCYERISCLIYKDKGIYEKLSEDDYKYELFEGLAETVEEVFDLLKDYGINMERAKYIHKLVWQVADIVCPMIACVDEQGFISEYAYAIDYVIKHKGNLCKPEMRMIFPTNYEDYHCTEGIAKEIKEYDLL